MNIQFDAGVKISYGFLSCKRCDSRYPIRCTPVHKPDCPVNGSDGNGDILYHYGMREVDLVMKDPHGRSPFGMLRRSDLANVFDELPYEVQQRMRELGHLSR